MFLWCTEKIMCTVVTGYENLKKHKNNNNTTYNDKHSMQKYIFIEFVKLSSLEEYIVVYLLKNVTNYDADTLYAPLNNHIALMATYDSMEVLRGGSKGG